MAEFAEDVRHVCMGITLERALDISRSDLSQEAWIKIWLQLERFLVHQDSTAPRQQFRVWLKQTARHEMLRVLEKRQAQKRQPPTPLESANEIERYCKGDLNPSSYVRRDEERQRLLQAVEKLEEASRIAIELCFLEGCTVQSMANKLGLSYSEARTRLSRAVTELRNYFVDPFP